MGGSMPELIDHICPKRPDKMDVSAKLAAAWSRVAAKMGKGTFCDKLGVDAKTLKRAVTGDSVPELHTALASLLADPTALDEVMALYGFEVRRRQSEPAKDFDTISMLVQCADQYVGVMADGIRDPRETCQLADAFRPLMARMSSIVSEADRIKGAH